MRGRDWHQGKRTRERPVTCISPLQIEYSHPGSTILHHVSQKGPTGSGGHHGFTEACAFWEPFHLGTSISVNYVAKLISGVDPELGFRFLKAKPLLRLIFIHTENRNETFSRNKVYAGFVDVGNRTILLADASKGRDWQRALMCNPGIQNKAAS